MININKPKNEYEEIIIGSVELFVNCVYDTEGQSGWEDATIEDWIKASYKEVIDNCKNAGGSTGYRFLGKEKIQKDLAQVINDRLTELAKEGYKIKALCK